MPVREAVRVRLLTADAADIVTMNPLPLAFWATLIMGFTLLGLGSLLLGLVFVAVGPSLLAYRAWGAGVARVGPSVAGFFANLTPLFAALLSTLLLGEPPQLYPAAGFMLIVGGIWVSARR